jgi:hypothetical protein
MPDSVSPNIVVATAAAWPARCTDARLGLARAVLLQLAIQVSVAPAAGPAACLKSRTSLSRGGSLTRTYDLHASTARTCAGRARKQDSTASGGPSSQRCSVLMSARLSARYERAAGRTALRSGGPPSPAAGPAAGESGVVRLEGATHCGSANCAFKAPCSLLGSLEAIADTGHGKELSLQRRRSCPATPGFHQGSGGLMTLYRRRRARPPWSDYDRIRCSLRLT